jgi:hypothetical protein
VADDLGADWRNSRRVHPSWLADAGVFGRRGPSGVVVKTALSFALAIIPTLFSPVRE